MDKKYLKEHNLYEAHKQFMRLCSEATYLPTSLEEEDDDQMNGDPSQGADPMGGMNGDPSQGADPMGGGSSMGSDPMGGMNGDPSQGADPMGGMNGDPSMGGDPSQGADPMGSDPSMGGDPMGGMGADPMGGDPSMGDEEEDDVLDVDELTDAQEKMNDKVNIVGKSLGKVDDKLETLMHSLESMVQQINQQNAEIEEFKKEFEKRNPTQIEKLNARSLSSFPFNVNPKDYWKQNGIDSNYEIYSDNDEPTNSDRSLEITNSDVDNFDDKTIEDSFDISDDMRQTIEKIFGL